MELSMLRQIKRLSCCALLLLVSCGYFNNYQKPNILVRNHWTAPDRYISHSNDKKLPYIAWWRGFNDPTLNALIAKGLKCNNTLNMSRGNVEAAAGELRKIRYQWVPTTGLILGYSAFPALGFPGVIAALNPRYLINIFEQIKQQKQAKYQLEQEKAEDDSVKLLVLSDIAAAYFTYLAEVDRKMLIQTLTQDITELAVIAKKVYTDGLSSDIDPEILDSQVNMILGKLEVVNQNIILAQNAIHYLINENPGQIKTTAKFRELKHAYFVPGNLPITVLENRPDMRKAGYRLRASNEAVGVAASNLLPSIFLDYIGGVGAGNSQYTFPHKSINFNDQLALAPIIKMTVLGEIDKAHGLEKVSYFNFLDTLQKALSSATNALSAHYRYTNKLKQTTQSVRHLEKAYKLNVALYKGGIQTYVDTLNSKIILDKMYITQNQDQLLQLLAVVKLYQELAGGYCAQ